MKSYFKFLSRNKAYTAIDVFGLAISMMFVVLIGCYTWQESHIDKQHSKADRMYYVGLNFDGHKSMGTHWYLQFILKDKFPEIETATGIYRNHRWLEYDGKQIETNCFFVDSTFFDIFDFKLIQGDPKTVLDNPSNIVVTPEYARKVWGEGDPMGKSIVFNIEEEPFIVAGVMEPMKNTALMTWDKKPVDMLLNFSMMKYVNGSLINPNMGNAAGSNLILLAKEGYDLTKKKQEYNDAVKKDYWILNLPEDNIHLEIFPFKDNYFDEASSAQVNFGDKKMIKLLFGVGIVILLFAIMNYINLTVALAGKRAKEMATRRLLGEERLQIMWRLIAESTILCIFSMLLGISLAFLMQPYASALLKTPIDIAGCINFTTIIFMIIVLLIMSLASGIIPALLLSSMKPIEAVKGSFRRKSNMVFSKIFIVIQNVATIVMIGCALTMYLQVRHLIEAPLGYNTEGIISIPFQYTERKQQDAELFRDELLKLSCVDKVSFSMGEPHNQGNNNTLTYEGKTISFQEFVVDTVFMDLFGLKLRKDNNEASVYFRHYLNRQALNELGIDENATDYTAFGSMIPIAGIVEDFKIGNVLTDQHPVRIITAKPFGDNVFIPWDINIKTTGDKQQALEQVKGVFEKVYSKELSDMVFETPFLSQQIEKDFDYQERLSTVLAIFALIAIMVSMLGLMAMSTYYVRQRSADIAVHKVMGGTSTEVMAKLVRPFMLYVLIAAVLSIPIIYYFMNDWLSQFSYRISIYWWIYAVAAILAIMICFASVVIQCYRAANTNPINSLK
ncbi:MAG: ABC transporter permease [Muribaculaceae bacterium]|nr:ABC transporter permease [Muribaculaceae bacterium]